MLALDGVRGIAILLVFVYHALRHMPHSGIGELLVTQVADSGWVGVDLFFALSGFLITGILLDGKESEGYFGRFYARRVLRILPLYLVYIVFALHVAPAAGLVPQSEAEQFSRIEPWYWTHTVNLLIASSGWRSAADFTGQLWSLGVEEQFYLLWPFVVFLLARKDMFWLLSAMVVAPPLVRAALIPHISTTAIYVLLPTRVDPLAVGAALALAFREPAMWQRCRQWARPLAAAATAVIALVAYRQGGFTSQDTYTQMIGYSAVALLAGAAIVMAIGAPGSSLAGRIWRHPALRFCGRYSYGMYVWHVVVMLTLRERLFTDGRLPLFAGSWLPAAALFVVVALALTIGVALASWYVVEKPFHELKRFVPYGSARRSTALTDEAYPVPNAANL